MSVPGVGAVADLLRATGAWSIQGPTTRFDAQDWWFRLRFDLEPLPDEQRQQAILHLDGLATIAEVWLNGQCVLQSRNMFVSHALAVGGSLRPQDNELVIVCRSLDHALTQRRPRPRWRAPMIENQQLRWFRTTVLGRTPGWSPPAAVVGPWRPVWLSWPVGVEVIDLRLAASLDADDGMLSCQGRFVMPPGRHWARAQLRLSRGEAVWTQALGADGDAGPDAWQVHLHVPGVAKWWPHTHGEPALYQAELQVWQDGASTPDTLDLGQVGFRKVEVDRRGDGFALRINDVEVFCRGACWTPLDPVRLDAPEAADYERALMQVRAAGMNMVRLGGTMHYEADAFYDACDRLGVMVWQEFMFANMDYPEDEAFVQEVRREVAQQCARWQGRPSIAVLCGNSEVEQQAAMFGATRDRWTPPLFHEVLPALISARLPQVPYWPSSAHGGVFPHQADVGTTSYYGVGAYQRDLDDARRAGVRFATECLAFSNIPETDGLARMPGGLNLRVHHPDWKLRAPRDLGAGWDFEDVRDHYVARLFKVDPARLRYSDHDRYLQLGRVAVGEVMAASFSEWRRPASSCRGALIWFLRDLWPGAGWGIVDSQGQAKAPYYFLQRTLQPIHVSLTDEGGNGYYVHVCNDTDQDLAAQLVASAWRHGSTRVAEGQLDVSVPARSARSWPLLAWFDWFADWSWSYRFGPPGAQVISVVLREAAGQQERARAFAFPAGLDLPVERDLGLEATARRVDPGVFEVTVRAERFVQSLHFDVDGGEPSDAYFHLLPGEIRTVTIRKAPTATTLDGCVRALNSDAMVNIRMQAEAAGA